LFIGSGKRNLPLRNLPLAPPRLRVRPAIVSRGKRAHTPPQRRGSVEDHERGRFRIDGGRRFSVNPEDRPATRRQPATRPRRAGGENARSCREEREIVMKLPKTRLGRIALVGWLVVVVAFLFVTDGQRPLTQFVELCVILPIYFVVIGVAAKLMRPKGDGPPPSRTG
jgi:uncharacterized membrane protein YhdT